MARNIERLVKGANFRYNDASVAQIDYTLRVVWTTTRWNVLPRWILSARVTTCSLPAVLKHGQKLPGYSSGYEACKAGDACPVRKRLQTDGCSENRQKQRDNRVGTEETRKNAAPNPRRPLRVPLDAKERAHLTEIIEDRHGRKSIIVTSQLPELDWYDAIGDTTVADAILDRIVHTAHRITLTGESVRKLKAFKGR